MIDPNLFNAVTAYLADTAGDWDDETVMAAIAAEQAAQARKCRIPTVAADVPVDAGSFLDGTWLAESPLSESLGWLVWAPTPGERPLEGLWLDFPAETPIKVSFTYYRIAGDPVVAEAGLDWIDLDAPMGAETRVDLPGMTWGSEYSNLIFWGYTDSVIALRDLAVTLPSQEIYPADLLEALCRRVAANLANRALPLGLQSSVSEAGVGFARIGGGDREVARLEAPYRKVVVG